MRLKEIETKAKENEKEALSFKDFYKYFKKHNYNLSIKTALNMYKIAYLKY